MARRRRKHRRNPSARRIRRRSYRKNPSMSLLTWGALGLGAWFLVKKAREKAAAVAAIAPSPLMQQIAPAPNAATPSMTATAGYGITGVLASKGSLGSLG